VGGGGGLKLGGLGWFGGVKAVLFNPLLPSGKPGRNQIIGSHVPSALFMWGFAVLRKSRTAQKG